jgi:hypothetical protein
MASKTLKGERSGAEIGRRTTLEQFGRDLVQRRAEYEAKYGHPPIVPRNSGANRTESKRALLVEIDKAAAAKGFKW